MTWVCAIVLLPRPLPYTPAFNRAFPQILTFVGTLDGVVVNEDGEELRVLISDLAHEVITPDSFASTNPIHAFFVDSDGRVRDRASLVGQVNIDRTTGEAVHQIVDRGTCHQTANLNLGPVRIKQRCLGRSLCSRSTRRSSCPDWGPR